MPFVGHLPEIFFLLILALIVFGPKRMIEMGSSVGKALRELREQVKDIPGMSGVANLGGLLGDDEPRRAPFSTMSQFSQSVGGELRDDVPAPSITTPVAPITTPLVEPTETSPIVEGTVAPSITVTPVAPAEPIALAEPRPEE